MLKNNEGNIEPVFKNKPCSLSFGHFVLRFIFNMRDPKEISLGNASWSNNEITYNTVAQSDEDLFFKLPILLLYNYIHVNNTK